MAATRRMCAPVFLFAYRNSDGTVADLLPSSVIGVEKGTGPVPRVLSKQTRLDFYHTPWYSTTELPSFGAKQ